jgi:hypothetical protein
MEPARQAPNATTGPRYGLKANDERNIDASHDSSTFSEVGASGKPGAEHLKSVSMKPAAGQSGDLNSRLGVGRALPPRPHNIGIYIQTRHGSEKISLPPH